MRTNCGLRTVVKILEIFNEVLEGKCGTMPCYNTVENWMKKLGLSVYENERKPCSGKKYAMVIDESIMINSEKLRGTSKNLCLSKYHRQSEQEELDINHSV